MGRYRLQEAFQPWGRNSTEQLTKSHVVIVGCGATGSYVANTLARMGVGSLTLVDFDVVKRENLHRQLFTENSCTRYKVLALLHYLQASNSDITVKHLAARVNRKNIADLVGVPDLIIDATDNMETRWLINDYSVKNNIPWIYSGVGRSGGMVMTIIPKITPCLRCVFIPDDEKDEPSGGIFPPIVAIVANMQAARAVKILTGQPPETGVRTLDIWTEKWGHLDVAHNPDCPTCGKFSQKVNPKLSPGFEKWVREKGTLSLALTIEGFYVDSRTQVAWEAWNAREKYGETKCV